MKKFTTPVLSFLLLLFAISLKAQTADTTKSSRWSRRHDFTGAAQLQVTYRQSNLGQLNTILNKNGIPSLSNSNIWLNASMNHVHKNWVWEDGIGFAFMSTSEANNIKAKYNQYDVFLRLGYNVSQNSNFRLWPFAGINLTGDMLRIQDDGRQNSTSDFSQELLNTTSSKTLFQPNFGIDLGVGFDYLIKMKDKKMDCFTVQRNIPIGFRIGYYIQTSNSDWKLDNHTLNNGPADKQSALFVTFNIGLGYSVKK